MKTALDSARAYLAKLPAAVSGAGGHNATLAAACWCVRFGLDDTDALALLAEFNQRCQPPWTEKELAHKLAAAHRKTTPQARALHLTAPAARLVWKLERKTPRACPPPAPTPEGEAVDKVSTAQQPGKTSTLVDTLTRSQVIRPGDPIPAALLPVLATWTALRQHPAWSGVQWPKTYENRPTNIRTRT